MEDAAPFGRLIDALRPWLGHLVIAGGWAHRLHRLHPLAHNPGHEPIRTRDVDFALSLRAPVAGDIGDALGAAGFTQQVTDTIREAARIPQDRILTPDTLRAACEYGLDEILGA